MVRLVVFLIGIAVAASGLSWLADRPGSLLINWQGYEIETSVFRAVVMLALVVGLAILTWSIVTALWRSPASIGMFFNRRRQMRGLEALSGGMIAIGAGDRDTATRYAVQARKALPNEPLTHLLRAQAAQLSGDRATARRMFEAMLGQPETEQLGLRGLFLEAEREGEREAARQFAERSVGLNPRLSWAVDALFDLQCKESDWVGALQTLTISKKHQHHSKPGLDRRRAVLMTARAQALEESDPNRAMNLAVEAHHLAHDLVPAAVLAGRMLAARGHTKRAAKIIERAWRRNPHPELALVYAHARIGDSPSDRLTRVKKLAQLNPHSIETPVAIATAAVEAKDWVLARGVLEALDSSRLTQRVCMLMARIEGEDGADKGRVREWLARAVHAPRDPAWVADGVVSEKWAPVSPITGAFDAFQWRAPADALDAADTELLAAKLDELVKLGAPVPAAAKPEVEAAPKRSATAPSRQAEDVVPATMPSRADAQLPRAVRVEAEERTRQVASVRKDGADRTSSVEVVSGAALASRKDTGSLAGESKVVEAKPSASVAAVSERTVSLQPSPKKALEPGMFIAPRAPDDPGVPGDAEAEPRKPTRVVATG